MFNSPILMQAATAIMLSGESRIAPHIANRKEYVPWNPMFLEEAKDVIRYYVGNAFNIAIWGFVIISGVFLVVNILNKYLG